MLAGRGRREGPSRGASQDQACQRYFAESLKGADAARLKNVCFARIDCDIYEPALECLHYLTTRLSDGAILVFDDWSFNPEVGETRAFFGVGRANTRTDFRISEQRAVGAFLFEGAQVKRSCPAFLQSMPRRPL